MTKDTLLWCFDYFYFKDKALSAQYLSPSRFSPITCRLYQALMEIWSEDEDISFMMAEVRDFIVSIKEKESE